MSDANSEPSMPSREWYDKQYDPRLPARPMPEILADWMQRSKLTQRDFKPETVRYGPHARELADIYRAPKPRGSLIFYHGGYWRACSKDDHAWIAPDFVRAGITVAVMNYPLCPEATLAEIAASARRAFVFMQQQVFCERELAKQIVVGHSAGGYLAADHLTTDWGALGLAANPLAGVLCISALVELKPLTLTFVNDWLRLTPEAAEALSITHKRLHVAAPTLMATGALESQEFHRQAQEMAIMSPENSRVIDVAGKNHFDVLDEFAYVGCSLFTSVMDLFER